MTKYELLLEKDYQILQNKYDKTKAENKLIKYEYDLLLKRFETKEKQLDIAINEFEINAKAKYQPLLDEKDKVIDEKNQEIARLKSLLGLDGTNSGISTSKTPINKNKHIPNTRKKSDKKIGGQEGHPKHKLEKFRDNEITENKKHELKACPKCNGELEEVGEICKDELSYRFVPIRRRHHFIKYKCKDCHKEVHKNIPNNLKEDNQYGSEIKSVALSLLNEGNVPMNKIRRIIKGFSENTIDMSEGFIAKIQKQAALKLNDFCEELKKELFKNSVLYWDDTVIMVSTKRACLRYYGNEKIALYKAHEKKDEKGILEDGILNTLSSKVSVMHDHNIINYKFDYINLECNIHLIRDLEKCYDNTQHEWCKDFKELVQKNIHKRKEYIEKGYNSFDDLYLKEFENKYDDILLKGLIENREKSKTFYDSTEKALIERILKYKDNYFIWMYDFELPYDNNPSERALRGAKSKMKIAGQFQNINYASYYANIKSYIETCYKNGYNPTEALINLMNDNPLSLTEILSNKNDEKLS